MYVRSIIVADCTCVIEERNENYYKYQVRGTCPLYTAVAAVAVKNETATEFVGIRKRCRYVQYRNNFCLQQSNAPGIHLVAS